VALAAGLVYIYLSLKKKKRADELSCHWCCNPDFFLYRIAYIGLVDTGIDAIYTSPFFYFELGVVCSIIFFLLGLFYKNRQELTLNIREQEAMKLEVEKQHSTPALLFIRHRRRKEIGSVQICTMILELA
jgi:hypothetical protein